MTQPIRDPDLAPREDDIVIESGSSALTVFEEPAPLNLQATIKSQATTLRSGIDKRDPGIENIAIEAPKANKDAAWFALKEYLVKRSANPLTRLVFRSVLDGVKPKYTKLSSIKHRFEFSEENGDPINSYEITLIEL